MKRILFVIIISISELYGQTGWEWTDTLSVWPLEAVQFLDENTGYIVGPSGPFKYVFKTTNGGTSWTSLTDTIYNNLKTLLFFNANTGYVAGNGGTVRKTTNGGQNWKNRNIPLGQMIRSISFYNDSTGCAIDGASKIYRTSNSGINWSTLNTGYLIHLYSIFILNNDSLITSGYLSGVGGVFLMTTNSGNNWIQTNGYDMWKIRFINNTTGIACGSSGMIVKTTNSGLNWSNLNTGSNAYLYGVNIVSPDFICAVGTLGNILVTTNSGINWNISIPYNRRFLSDVFFLNENTGWVVGDSGIVLKTTNGGLTFTQKQIEFIQEAFSLSQNYPNPFNPVTKIRFDIPSLTRRGAGVVVLKVYDIMGREVQTLVNEQLQPGTYEVDFNGSNFSSGVYYYRLEVAETTRRVVFTETKKMVLVK